MTKFIIFSNVLFFALFSQSAAVDASESTTNKPTMQYKAESLPAAGEHSFSREPFTAERESWTNPDRARFTNTPGDHSAKESPSSWSQPMQATYSNSCGF